jgi:polyhydroxyalkanoate synthesis regulator phasin
VGGAPGSAALDAGADQGHVMTIDQDTPAGHERAIDSLGRYAELAAGLTRTTLSVTERALAQFVRQGEVAAEHAERLVEDVITRSVQGSGAVGQLVRGEVERAIGRAGFARADELEGLRREVDALRAELTARDAQAAGGDARDDD